MAEINKKKLQRHIPVRFSKQDIEALYAQCKTEIGINENEELENGDFSRWYRRKVKTQILTNNGTKQGRNHRSKKNDAVAL